LIDFGATKGRANPAKTQEIAGIFASAMEKLQKIRQRFPMDMEFLDVTRVNALGTGDGSA
jgi:hypothetical protein